MGRTFRLRIANSINEAPVIRSRQSGNRKQVVPVFVCPTCLAHSGAGATSSCEQITPAMATTALGPTELRSILTFTVNLARLAGTIILEGSQAIQSASFIDEKKNSADLVTEYDVAVENLVMTEIKNEYPSFKL